jgi:predicted dienelactone hydrolase
MTTPYDPFVPGPFPVDVHTIQASDTERGRIFPCELWSPLDTKTATHPLIVFSHSSGGGRSQSTFLCTHLASHGYLVAALDHSETIAPELARQNDETPEQKSARGDAWMANRPPDVRFLIDYLLSRNAPLTPDPARIGAVGHSFGGWTVLAAPDIEPRIRAIVALAPAGSSIRKPGIMPAELSFAWGRDVPTLYLVAEDDVSLPLAGMYELFDRTPGTKQMVVLRRADHLHFMDEAEQLHEAVRAMTFPGDLAWLPKEMRPIGELCSGAEAHLFTRGLALAHFDATLREHPEARLFLAGDLEAELAARGIDAFIPGTAPQRGPDGSRPRARA